MKLGSSRGMDTKRPRGSERSKPCHQLRLTRRSQPPYPWPPEQAQPGVSKPCRTTQVGKEFAAHGKVDHSREEYAYHDRATGTLITTNTVEGYYSIFKRGMIGVYQHCGEQHLHRYLSEFDFRYSNRSALGVEDTERATLAAKGARGKRLTYRSPRNPRTQQAGA